MSVSIQIVQLLHDGVNFFCLRFFRHDLSAKLLGSLQFNAAVDADGCSVGLIIDAFRWIFGHGDGVFFQLEVWLVGKVV